MKIGKILLISAGAIIVILIGWALASDASLPSGVPVTTFSPRPAPDFKLELFSGEIITLGDFTGKKPVVINFWASWCQSCRDEALALAEVARRYEGRVEFIGVAEGDARDKALAFINEFGVSYPNGLDRDNIGTKYGITGIPETFWIDDRGQIVDHWIGPIDEANLTTRIRRLLK